MMQVSVEGKNNKLKRLTHFLGDILSNGTVGIT